MYSLTSSLIPHWPETRAGWAPGRHLWRRDWAGRTPHHGPGWVLAAHGHGAHISHQLLVHVVVWAWGVVVWAWGSRWWDHGGSGGSGVHGRDRGLGLLGESRGGQAVWVR